MNFKSASAVVDTIRALDEVEQIRGLNRVKITDAANGVPPLSSGEAEKMKLKVNCNFGEMAVLASHAKRQYLNAFMRPSRFFRVSLPTAPVETQAAWQQFITQHLNRVMKRSRSYFFLKQNQFASLVLHGLAPQMWLNKDGWLAKYVAIEDFRVPTDSEISTDSWEWFAVRQRYTEGELSEAVFGPHADKAWNKQAISPILKEYHDKNFEACEYDWMTAPEKMSEYVKQNLGYYCSDAVPTIPLWKFYHKKRDKQGSAVWSLKIVPDLGVRGANDSNREFLAQKDTWATDISQILHIQFGDLNSKAPYLFHSVRSLGFLLMEPTFWSNMLNCRFLQHTFESFNIWLRVANPADKSRSQKVEMYDQAVIPEGVSVVPQTERHQIDPKMVDMAKGLMRQLQAEAAASYTQKVDDGTSREQTAYETAVKVSQVNAMMGGLLVSAFFNETFAYREICRRFCLKGTTDPDAREFQQEAKRRGIPAQFLDVKVWDIDPEIPLGSGQPVMEIAQAGQLMANREKYPPAAQQEILHEFTAAVTQNSAKADRLVPLEGRKPVSHATEHAVSIFGTLMQGVPVPDQEEYNPIDQIEALMGMLGTAVAQAERMGNMATPQQLQGFAMVVMHIKRLIQRLGLNPIEKERVRAYMDQVGKVENVLKGFAQRLKEQMEAQQKEADNGKMQETAAKIAATRATTLSAIRMKEAKAEQALRHKEQSFAAEQDRKDNAALSDMERGHARTMSEMEQGQARTMAEMEQGQAMGMAEMDQSHAEHMAAMAQGEDQHQAEMAQAKEKAKAAKASPAQE